MLVQGVMVRLLRGMDKIHLLLRFSSRGNSNTATF